jgi:ATP/maltotriose-dependent transcriptional regulator MalT
VANHAANVLLNTAEVLEQYEFGAETLKRRMLSSRQCKELVTGPRTDEDRSTTKTLPPEHRKITKLYGGLTNLLPHIGSSRETGSRGFPQQVTMVEPLIFDNTCVSLDARQRRVAFRGKTHIVARLACVQRNLTGRSVRSFQMRMGRAWTTLLALDVDQVLAQLLEIEPVLSDFEAPLADQLRAGMSVLRAMALAVRDDCVAALPIALSCLGSAGPAFAPALSAIAGTLCRLAYWKLGDFARFHSVGEDQTPTRKQRDLSLLAFDRAMEAAVELQQLRFGAASRLAQDVLTLVPRRPRGHAGFASLLATALLFQLRYEEGALAEAEESVRDVLPLIRSRGSPETVIRVYPLLAKIARHRTRGDLAMLTLAEGEALGQSRGWSRLVAACLEERIELLVRAERIDEAESCLGRMQSLFAGNVGSHYVDVAVRRHFSLARARIALTRAPSFQIVATLKHLQQEATASGDLYLAVRLTIRLAEALAALDEDTDATETLMRSLELGASVGMYQSFVDAGPAVGELLTSIVDGLAPSGLEEGEPDRRSLMPYMKSVLRSWRITHQAGTDGGGKAALRLSGPLSPREHTILQLISRGHSNKRVAQQLRIAPETVKSHAKRIFVKLGAQSRLEAVSKAMTLGLI